MEKISIVRRRLEIPATQAELRARQRMDAALTSQSDSGPSTALLTEPGDKAPLLSLAPPAGTDGAAQAPPGAAEVTVDLSDEARNELWSGGHLDETASGKRHFIVEAEKVRESERVVLRLQFMKPDYFLRLLTTEEVCEMLHVSKSSLYEFAHDGSLRSFRMGRGLRFRFQDILEFLTSSQTQSK